MIYRRGWVSTSRLPGEGVRVCIRTITGEEEYAKLIQNQLMYEGEPPYWIGDNDTYELSEVTHWREIRHDEA